MASIGLTAGDAIVIGTMIKSVLDLLNVKRDKPIELDDLLEMCQKEEVRSMILDDERRAAVARFSDRALENEIA
jgi:hypothetical protein